MCDDHVATRGDDNVATCGDIVSKLYSHRVIRILFWVYSIFKKISLMMVGG